jgi:hypothetical protein
MTQGHRRNYTTLTDVTLEHTQLALSLIVQEQYPADAEHLIAQALSNVREHHG